MKIFHGMFLCIVIMAFLSVLEFKYVDKYLFFSPNTQNNTSKYEVVNNKKQYETYRKKKQRNNVNRLSTKASQQQKESADELFWPNLRTTFVVGVYCQKVADDGTYRRQKHFFYNTQKQQMVEVKDCFFVSKPEDLGAWFDEYQKYAVKGDRFVHKGKVYKITTYK